MSAAQAIPMFHCVHVTLECDMTVIRLFTLTIYREYHQRKHTRNTQIEIERFFSFILDKIIKNRKNGKIIAFALYNFWLLALNDANVITLVVCGSISNGFRCRIFDLIGIFDADAELERVLFASAGLRGHR